MVYGAQPLFLPVTTPSRFCWLPLRIAASVLAPAVINSECIQENSASIFPYAKVIDLETAGRPQLPLYS